MRGGSRIVLVARSDEAERLALLRPGERQSGVGDKLLRREAAGLVHQFLGQRIGPALLGQAICEAAAKAALVWLDVLEENERAVSFYRKHGFAVVGTDTYAIGARRFAFHIMTRVRA